MELFPKKIGPVFLKEDSESTEFIKKMTALSSKATGKLKEDIEKDIKLAKYGEYGENNISFELKNSGIDMYILHDIYLEHNGLSAQIDYMVFTRKRIYVIECKNLIGDITIDNEGNFVRTYTLGNKTIKEGIYSPITQNERHLEVIKQLRGSTKNMITRKMFESSFYNNYISLVLLSNPKTILNDRYAKKEVKQKVHRVDQLINTIKTMDALNKDYTNSTDEMEELARFFLDASKPNKSDYSKKYEDALNMLETEKSVSENKSETGNDISNSIDKTLNAKEDKKKCPKCGSELILRTATKGSNQGKQFYGCSGFPNCRYILNI